MPPSSLNKYVYLFLPSHHCHPSSLPALIQACLCLQQTVQSQNSDCFTHAVKTMQRLIFLLHKAGVRQWRKRGNRFRQTSKRKTIWKEPYGMMKKPSVPSYGKNISNEMLDKGLSCAGMESSRSSEAANPEAFWVASIKWNICFSALRWHPPSINPCVILELAGYEKH